MQADGLYAYIDIRTSIHFTLAMSSNPTFCLTLGICSNIGHNTKAIWWVKALERLRFTAPARMRIQARARADHPVRLPYKRRSTYCVIHSPWLQRCRSAEVVIVCGTSRTLIVFQQLILRLHFELYTTPAVHRCLKGKLDSFDEIRFVHTCTTIDYWRYCHCINN